ncbi:hypothetical protein HRbin36_00412 [bacterium HR36]|uniref:Lipoprotein n=1 Tax=uncultured Planctomycetota bacterium TaxID=120965 RepID=H5SDE9_9BACT|nr:hypothetical protein HGMM_F13D05C07 [uncultured Planctomycetota bacterium]GBD35302.1 hypothetical protein HRbin36_00412 [bacterium HR36]
MWRRAWVTGMVGIIYLASCGCQSLEKQALEPLPADGPPLAYSELVERARRQVWAAQEIFYRDNWEELIKASDALHETGQRLAQFSAERVPARCREVWPKPVEEFRQAVLKLRESARQHDAIQSANAFQTLHLVLKQIRPD